MDGNESQSSPGNDSGNGGAPQTAQRPDYLPEKFWVADKGQPNVEGLAKSYTELERQRAQFSQTREQWQQEYDAGRLKNRPAKAEDYKFAVPENGPLAERFSKQGLVLLDKMPGADFKPEEGKKYFVMDPNSPLLGFWRQHAHAMGMSNDDFMGGVAAFAEAEMAKNANASESIRAEVDAEMKKLGDHGRERANFAFDKLKALLGDDKAKAFDFIKVDAAGTESVEALLEKLGEPRFSPGAGGSESADAEAALSEAKKLQGEPDYWQNPEKQKRVAEAFKKAFPGPATGTVQPSFAR